MSSEADAAVRLSSSRIQFLRSSLALCLMFLFSSASSGGSRSLPARLRSSMRSSVFCEIQGRFWGGLGGGEVSGSRFCDGLGNALVGLLDVVVVKVCGYLQVVEEFVKGRLEGCKVVVGGLSVCAFWAVPV